MAVQFASCQLTVNLTVPDGIREGDDVPIVCVVSAEFQIGTNILEISRVTDSQSSLSTLITTEGSMPQLTGDDDDDMDGFYQQENGTYALRITIRKIDRQEKGDYVCNSGGIKYWKTVDVYFPPYGGMSCSKKPSHELSHGDELLLYCSSDAGNPPVSLKWYLFDKWHPDSPQPMMPDINGVVSTSIQLTLREEDHRSIVICARQSKIYPEYSSNCKFDLLVAPRPGSASLVLPNVMVEYVIGIAVVFMKYLIPL